MVGAGHGRRRRGAAARVGVVVVRGHLAGACRRRDGDVHGPRVGGGWDRGRDLGRAVGHGADTGDCTEVDHRLDSPAREVGAPDRHAPDGICALDVGDTDVTVWALLGAYVNSFAWAVPDELDEPADVDTVTTTTSSVAVPA